jgi:hypothetical protein
MSRPPSRSALPAARLVGLSPPAVTAGSRLRAAPPASVPVEPAGPVAGNQGGLATAPAQDPLRSECSFGMGTPCSSIGSRCICCTMYVCIGCVGATARRELDSSFPDAVACPTQACINEFSLKGLVHCALTLRGRSILQNAGDGFEARVIQQSVACAIAPAGAGAASGKRSTLMGVIARRPERKAAAAASAAVSAAARAVAELDEAAIVSLDVGGDDDGDGDFEEEHEDADESGDDDGGDDDDDDDDNDTPRVSGSSSGGRTRKGGKQFRFTVPQTQELFMLGTLCVETRVQARHTPTVPRYSCAFIALCSCPLWMRAFAV